MAKSKKIIIIAIVAVVLIAVITTGTILTLNVINNKNAEKTKVIPTTETAKALRDKAEEARKNNEAAKAKDLLVQAQQQIKELPKTDANTNAKVDVDAQIWLLEHPTTVPTSAPTP